MEPQNLLNPKTLLSLPRFICYALLNKNDKKFQVYGTESFLSHYADQLNRIKNDERMKRDALMGKFEVVILETRQATSDWEHDGMNDLLLITKWYDSLIESGYSPYKEGGMSRVVVRVGKEEDGSYSVYAKTVRRDTLHLANFPTKEEALVYKKFHYDGKDDKIYKLIQYRKE